MIKKIKKSVKKVVKKKPAKSKPRNETNASVHVLLDRSGSMSGKWDETLSSLNVYVAGLKNVHVTLAAFDEYNGFCFDLLRDSVKPDEWQKLTNREVMPRGTTPLFDAAGKLCTRALLENNKRSTIVIITDGHENASREVTREKAKALLDDCRAKGWEVIFLGADFDAMGQGISLGASASKILNVAPQAMAATMDFLSAKTMAYATRGMGMDFNDQDRRIAGSYKVR